MINTKRILLLLFVILGWGCNNSSHKVLKKYFSNGNIEEIDSMKDGKRNGGSIKYSEQGKIVSYFSYKNDSVDGKFYITYTDGNIWSQGTYVKGIRDGLFLTFTENGDTLSYTVLSKGEPVVEGLFRDGKRRAIVDHKRNLRIMYTDTGIVAYPL